ncbi:MAG: hypothetical protein ACLQPD_11035 [Desulfomonilaceae bacterium]
MDTLIDEGFRILLHGHIHKDEPRVVSYGRGKAAKIMWLIPAGSFGTEGKRLASGYPWQYNLIRIERNNLKIFSRIRQKPLAPWKPAYDESPVKGEPPRQYWEIDLQ